MLVFEPILRIVKNFSFFKRFIGNIYPVRYAVLLKGQLLLSHGVNPVKYAAYIAAAV